MKKFSFSLTKGILLGFTSVAAVSACVIAANVNNSFKASDNGKVNLVANEIVEAQAPKTLVEAENEVSESKAKVEEATKELEKATEIKEEATKEVVVAEEALNKAKEDKKLAEAEVKNAKTEEERAQALEKVEAAEEAVTKAEATKKDAEAKVQNAEKAIEEAKDNKKVAEQKVQKAEEDKKTLEEEIRKTQETEEPTLTQVTKKETETKKENETVVETKSSTSESKKETMTETKTTPESKKTTENQNNNNSKSNNNNNATVTNPSTNESKSLTDEQLQRMLELAAKGEAEDRKQYEEAYNDKYGHYPEEKHEVEFHFYSTLNPITVRLYDHNNYYTTSRCGATGSGCIWFAEFSCDLNECVGFLDTNTNELKGNVLYARRASIKEYTMKAPEARYGYKFKQWEIISDRKNITVNGQTGIAYKYVAVYEKIQ